MASVITKATRSVIKTNVMPRLTSTKRDLKESMILHWNYLMFKAATEKVQVVQDDELKFKVQYLDSFQYSNIQILNFHLTKKKKKRSWIFTFLLLLGTWRQPVYNQHQYPSNRARNARTGAIGASKFLRWPPLQHQEFIPHSGQEFQLCSIPWPRDH